MLNKLSSHKFYWLIPPMLIIVNLLCFWQTVSYDFVWDDQRIHIANNQALMEEDYARFWKKPYEGLYIPVSYNAWIGIKSIAEKKSGREGKKLSPAPFHIANVLTHTINALLVFLLIGLLFENLICGLLAGLLFSVHPLQVESVAWISEFRGLLAACCSFLSMTVYVYVRKNLSIPQITRLLLFGGICIIWMMGMLAKPIAIVTPLILMVLEIFHFQTRTWYKLILPFLMLLVSIPVQIITMLAQPAKELASEAPLWGRPFIAGDAINFSLWKFFAPFSLSVTYGRKPEWLLEQWWMWGTVLIPIVLLWLLWRYRTKIPHLFTGFLIFIVAILPVSGLLAFYFQKFSTVADRYAYFPLLGIVLALSGIYAHAKFKNWILGIYAGLALLWLTLTLSRVETWQNGLTLWQDAVAKYPNQPRAHSNLGINHHNRGHYRQAIEHYNKAIEANPDFVKAYVNTGNSYAFMRKYTRAIKNYNDAIAIDSTYANAYYNRAVAFFQTKRFKKALRDMKRAEELGYPVNPRFKRDLRQRLQREK